VKKPDVVPESERGTASQATPILAEPLRRVSQFCAAAAIAIGALVLAGWLFDVRVLMQVLPGQVAMVPNTALGFLLAGVALWQRASHAGRSRVAASRAAAAVTGLLGFLNLVEYVSGKSLGFDELLFRDPAGLTGVLPGRMAVITAVGFVALAAALLTLDLHRAPWTSDGLALLPGILAMVSLTGYAFGVGSLYWIGVYKGMAINTALAFLALTVGVLFVHARGLSRLLVSDTAGGVLARRILPFALLAPVLFGWLRIGGEQLGLYGPELGGALHAVFDALILTVVLLGTTAALMRADEKRRSSEQALREAEKKYRSIFENAIEGIFQNTPEGRFITVNPSFARMLGYASPEELLAATHDIESQLWVHPEKRQEYRRLLETNGFVTGFEVELRRKDGSILWASDCSRMVRGPTGAIEYFEGTLEDITGRRQLETQLRVSQKMEAIGRLAGGIAHDFNNLLTAILGYSELMEEQLPDDEDLLSSLHEIHKAGERAAALTRQLLAFSRRQVLQPKVLDLNAVVSEVEKLLRRLIGEDVELVTRLDPALGSVKADPGQLEQVLMNLAVNARDAMPEGGTLTVETANTVLDTGFTTANPGARSGEYAILTVTDTGIGMSDEVRSHAFEPFFTTKEHGKGTGLGLATAYGIVKQSDGYITVDSEPGRGTTFRIYFPRAAGAAAASGRGERPMLSPRGTETILLVEDKSGVRRLSRTILEAQGYIVLEAASGDEALEVARAHAGEIHLVATDVVMPGMSGRVLWDRLRVVRPDPRVLFMSGYTDDAITRHGVLEPGIAFLQKPFTPFGLAQKVREVLDAPARADG
jgi:two-component system, cell cycle sensor histidine kinase and response regulator CckA